jgi:MFS family permease
MLTDATPAAERGRVMGLAEFSSGWTVGPPLGALLFAAGGWTLPFAVLGVLPIVGVALLAWARRTLASPGTDGIAERPFSRIQEPQSTVELVRRVSSWELYLVASCPALTWLAWNLWDLGYTPWIQAEFGFSAGTAALFFAIPPLVYTVCSIAAGWLSDRHDKRAVVASGLVVEGLAFVVAAGWLARYWPWAAAGMAFTSSSLRLGVSVLGGALIGCGGPLVVVPCLPEMVAIAARSKRREPEPCTPLSRSDHELANDEQVRAWMKVSDDDIEGEAVHPASGVCEGPGNPGSVTVVVPSAPNDTGNLQEASMADEADTLDETDEQTTNMVSGVFTTCTNTGGS